MKNISFWFVFLGTIFALAGMVWGVQMSISQDHLLAPAHAHNNLVGYVTMVLYGLYYAVVPAAGKTTLSRVHFWLSFLGAVAFGPGIALAVQQKGEAVVQIATLGVIAGMVIFAWTVWSNRSALSGS